MAFFAPGRGRFAVGIALGFSIVYLWAFPYFERLRSANEVPRIFLTQEIVDRGTFRLDARWPELAQGSTFDVSTTPEGHKYSNKAPGASFLAIPGYLLLKGWHRLTGGAPTLRESTWVFRVTAVTLPALLFLIAFARVARRLGGEAGGRGALVAYALGSMALPYALLFYSHQVAAACAGAAFACALVLADGGARPRTALALGFLAGLAVLVDYQSVLASAGVGVFLLARARHRLRDAALALAGAVPPAALLLFYHWACFGSPLRTGYSFAPDPAHRLGVLGVIGPNRAAMAQALIAPSNGLLVLSPWVLLAIVGAFAARRRPEAIACAAIATAYLLFVGSLVPEFGRAGWSVGPRYLGVAMPFIGWLAAAGLGAVDGRPAVRALAHALVLVGVVVHVAAAATYPHWPTSFENPLYQVSFRALARGLAPHSIGTALGLSGVASLAPMFLAAAALALALLGTRRRRWVTTAVAAALAAAIVVAYGRFPRDTPPDKWRFIESQWEP